LLIRTFKTKYKRNPLNLEMLRSPGQSLREKIENASNNITECLINIITIPLIIYCVVATQYIITKGTIDIVVIFFYICIAIITSVYFSLKLYKLLKYRTKCKLGYDCELMAGQELLALMKEGFNIFHDFPAGSFNIDHIAVGPTGIFAIETKGRAKNKVIEKRNWEVEFNGKQLVFPGWTETKPITQAIDQAKWLKNWIKKTTGHEYKVEPVLILPGWFIKRTGASDLKIYAGKNPTFLAKGPILLNAQQIQSISYQIEQKCRDVVCSAYNDFSKSK